MDIFNLTPVLTWGRLQSHVEKTTFEVNDRAFSAKGVDDQWARTVLGAIRLNPFTISVIGRAYSNLYGGLQSPVEITNLYVKFEPISLDEMLLLEATNEVFYDFPLEYKVIDMGDYYQEISEETLPILYAIVDSDFVFPNVPYTILSELNLDKSNPLLMLESFKLTSNQDEIKDYIFGSGLDIDIIRTYHEDVLAASEIPELPDYDCPPGYGWVLVFYDFDPTDPNWTELVWECQKKDPPPTPILNDCGCTVSSNLKRPGGCVQVEDTKLSPGFRGVRRVKVIAKDTWFGEDETWTDDKGCWNISKSFNGRGWFWIRFTNDRIKIRGTAANWKGIWQWITTVKDYVGVKKDVFNDITVKYELYLETGSQAQRYWGAATVNNAMHEFYDYASFDGINTPPNKLDVYVGRNHTYGYALMSAQNFFSQTTALALAAATFWAGPFQPLIVALGGIGMQAYLPDVYIGINYNNSDRLKRLAYHEFAHASHFTNSGDVFWGFLVAAEVFANGHGDQFSSNAGIIAVCESWAEHIGLIYTDRTYGTTSINYEQILETRRNESLNHIPIGLYNDLIDNSPDIVNACDANGNSCGVINDQVSGLTNAILFNLLDGTTTSPQIFINRLNSASSPALQNQINTLFADY